MSYVYTPLFTDTFHRADETPLNPATWINNVSGYDPLSVVSNLCVDETFVFGGWEFAAVVLPNDQYAEITINSLVTAGSNLQLYLRSAVSPLNSYYYYLDLASTGVLNLYESTNSGFTTNLLGTATVVIVPGAVLHLEAVGTNIVGKYNGTTVISVVDSSIPGGYSGIFLDPFSSVSDVSISKFVTGSVTQGGGGGGGGGSSAEQEFGTTLDTFASATIRSHATGVMGSNIGTRMTR